MLNLKTHSSIASYLSKAAKNFLKPRALASSTLFYHPLAYFSKQTTEHPNSDLDQEAYSIILHHQAAIQSVNWDSLYEYNDKFGLAHITDVGTIYSMLKEKKYEYSLNDLVHFLRRITELEEYSANKQKSPYYMDFLTLTSNIKGHLTSATQEYPWIGSIANCYNRLEYKRDDEFWLVLGDYVIDERHFPNFRESAYGLAGFLSLIPVAEKEFVNKVYDRLERDILNSKWEVNASVYQYIAKGMIEAERTNPKIMERVEYLILKNLDKSNDIPALINILFAFAKKGYGSLEFYYSLETVITKIHNLTAQKVGNKAILPAPLISSLCEIYRRASEIHSDLALEPEFKVLLHGLLTNENIHYRLEHIVQVLENYDVFAFEDMDVLNKLFERRVLELKGHMSAYDMIRYIDAVTMRELEGDYSQFSKTVLRFFDEYLKKNLAKQDKDSLHYYVQDIEARGFLDINYYDFINTLVEFMGKNLDKYDFEEMCFYFWLFNKYNHLVDMENKQIAYYMNVIKDQIRLFSAFGKGRLVIGSNFYKMLEVVTGSDFLTQGDYPDW